MATRKEVFAAIDSERDYQDRKWPAGLGAAHTVGDYLVMLATYVQVAQLEWTNYRGDAHALEIVRKIGGIAVHCMEDHGAPLRAGA
jgi:hypothetical protein